MQYIWAPLGMDSVPVQSFNISGLNPDGTPAEKLIRERLREAANKGAHAFRDFTWYWHPDDPKALSPFKFELRPGAHGPEPVFDLERFNERFFERKRLYAKICREFNLEFHHNLYNQCEFKYYVERTPGGEKVFVSPWKRNVQELSFYDGFFQSYLSKTLSALGEFDNVRYEVCNEPVILGWMAQTIDYLLKHIGGKNPADKIITGVDYRLKEIGGQGQEYRSLRSKLDGLGHNGGDLLRTQAWSVVHGITMETLKELFNHNVEPGKPIPVNHTRKVIFSADGTKPRLSRERTAEIVEYIYETKPKAIEAGNYRLEVVGGKEIGIPLYLSLDGAVGAFKKITGNYPENYGKFPSKIQTPVIEPDPQKEPIYPGKAPAAKPEIIRKAESAWQFLKKNKRTIGIAIVAIILLFLVLGGCKKAPDPIISALEERNSRLTAEIAALRADIGVKDSEISKSESSAKQLKTELSALESENVGLKAHIGRMQTKKPEQVDLQNCQAEYQRLFEKEQACYKLQLQYENTIEICKSRSIELEATVSGLKTINLDLRGIIDNQTQLMGNRQAISKSTEQQLKKKARKALKTGVIVGIVGSAIVTLLLRK